MIGPLGCRVSNEKICKIYTYTRQVLLQSSSFFPPILPNFELATANCTRQKCARKIFSAKKKRAKKSPANLELDWSGRRGKRLRFWHSTTTYYCTDRQTDRRTNVSTQGRGTTGANREDYVRSLFFRRERHLRITWSVRTYVRTPNRPSVLAVSSPSSYCTSEEFIFT